jgi:hypothetical protein
VAEISERDDEYYLTNADWGKIHVMAWTKKVQVKTAAGETIVIDDFSSLLESDPTTAINYYFNTQYYDRPDLKSKKLKIVRLRPAPYCVPESFWEDVNPFPPSCC